MERGILMEVRGRQGILLTGTGEFRRVDLGAGKWQVGDEIAAPLARTGRPWLRTVVAAAAAVLFLVGAPTGYWQWSLLQPSVVLAMEINPAFEFTLNGKSRVISARGLNADGDALVQGLTWQNLPVDQVVRAATEQAVVMGKLDPASAEGAILITVAPVKGEALPEQKALVLTETAQTAAETSVQTAATAQGKAPQAQVATTPVTKSEVEAARAEGLTLPEYKLFKYVQQSRPEVEVTPESFQQKGPGQVLKELEISPAEVMPSIRRGRGQENPPGQGQQDDRGGDRDQDEKKDDKKEQKQEDAKPASNRPEPANPKSGQGAGNGNGNGNGNGQGNGKGKKPDENPGNSSRKDGQGSDSAKGVGPTGIGLLPELWPQPRPAFGNQPFGPVPESDEGNTSGNGRADEQKADQDNGQHDDIRTDKGNGKNSDRTDNQNGNQGNGKNDQKGADQGSSKGSNQSGNNGDNGKNGSSQSNGKGSGKDQDKGKPGKGN